MVKRTAEGIKVSFPVDHFLHLTGVETKLSAKDLALATYDGNKLIPFKYEKDKKGNDIFM